MFVSTTFQLLACSGDGCVCRGNSCKSDFWPRWKSSNLRDQMHVCAGHEIIRLGTLWSIPPHRGRCSRVLKVRELVFL